jgi:hypothetical protein
VLLECGKCGPQTSVTAGTIFQDTRKPLREWFRANVLGDHPEEWSIVAHRFDSHLYGG